MGGRLHAQQQILAAAHFDDFMVHHQRLPDRVIILIIPLSVELLDIQILHVGVERGETPGHVLVVAGDDVRHSRRGDSGGVVARSAQIRHVPDRGRGEG